MVLYIYIYILKTEKIITIRSLIPDTIKDIIIEILQSNEQGFQIIYDMNM